MSTAIFPSATPLGRKPLPEVTVTPANDVALVVRRAREAQALWAALPVAKRIKAIAALKNVILARAEEIARLVSDETGKPEVEALLSEVLPSADVVAYWVENIAEELEPYEAEIDALSFPKKQGRVTRVPRGTVAVIMPWNFPFALPLRTIVPALLAGNAVVFKPSEVTPRVGQLVVEIFRDIVPEGLLGIVQGAAEIGTALVADDVDFVVFTGSPTTGRAIARACADRLVPCTLELGGKDAAIVLADADLDRAANGIVWGAMMNAGQNCGSVERVYAVKAISAPLTAKIASAVKGLRFGIDVGPLTTERQREIVAKHVAAAKAAGADVVEGGDAVGDPTTVSGYRPTVLTIDDDAAEIIAEETFGPVVPITAVDDVEEAIRRANASRYGLTASIWTSDLRLAEALALRLRAGTVTVNNHGFSGALPSVPWGGIGESGWGSTGSPHALEALTKPRVFLVDRNRAARESWWFPYTPTLRSLALGLAALRGGARSFGGKIAALFSVLSLFPKRVRELKTGTPRES